MQNDYGICKEQGAQGCPALFIPNLIQGTPSILASFLDDNIKYQFTLSFVGNHGHSLQQKWSIIIHNN